MVRVKSDEIRTLMGANHPPNVGSSDSGAKLDEAIRPDWRQAFLSPVSFRAPEQIVSSAWHEHAPFTFWLVEKLKPRLIVELGAHNGFSYFALCQGVRMAGLASAAFAIDSWTGDEHAGFYGEEIFARVWQYNREHYADFSTLMKTSFSDALPYFSDASIDLLHIDGRHYYDDVKADFEAWLPKLSDRAVVLFHDTNVRERGFGVQRFWDSLSKRYPSFTFVHGYGLGVLGVGSALPSAVEALLIASRDEQLASSIKTAYARLGAAVSGSFQAAEAKAAAEAAAKEGVERSATELAAEHRKVSELSARVSELEEHCRTVDADLMIARRGLEDMDKLKEAEAQHEQELEQRKAEIARLTEDLLEARRHQHELDAEFRSIKRSWPFQLSQAALTTRRRINSARRLIRHGRAEPLFDSQWYLRRYPDVARSGTDPFRHYVLHGAAEGRDPHPLFDTSWYLANNPDVAASGNNPLIHFSRFGARELRSPHPLFDCRWYQKQRPDVFERGLNPLEHYLENGAAEGLDPHPLFDTSWYLDINPDIATEAINPLVHFVEVGARELRAPHPLFDARWYVERYPDVLQETANPLEHYLILGAGEGRDPNPMFDTNWYRTTYPESGPFNPLIHYITIGVDEGLKPSPLADSS